MELRWSTLLGCLLVCFGIYPPNNSGYIAADDWPMWRYDANRSAAAPHPLPETLQPMWSRDFAPRRQAWDDPLNLDLMGYDRVLEPIVVGSRLFLGLNDSDQLLAIDTQSGNSVWNSFAEAPVRLPPAAGHGNIYFCSDDGKLYCVRESDGQLVWQFHGAPNRQQAIGNRRLTSAWPARGGPVLRDGTVYFAASIWPFMGTFLYALDAESGRVQWVNDATGSQYLKQPHSAPSFAGVAPQGALVATAKDLIVPGGRSVPAVFDRSQGKLRYFEINAGGKGTGGSFVCANEEHFFVHTRHQGTRAFDLATGLKTAFMPNQPVLAGERIFSAELDDQEVPVVRAYNLQQEVEWEIEADGRGDLILVGDQLYAAGHHQITAIRLPSAGSGPQITLRLVTPEPIARLIAADSKLFAVSLEGKLTAYGSLPDANHPEEPALTARTSTDRRPQRGPNPGKGISAKPEMLTAPSPETLTMLEAIGHQSPAEGYGFWIGRSDAAMVEALTQAKLFTQLAVIDSDAERVDTLRRRFDATGDYGAVTIHHSSPQDFRPPNYVAHKVFIGPDVDLQANPSILRHWYSAVRPFGGTMHLFASHQLLPGLAQTIEAMDLEQALVTVHPGQVSVQRVGPLPGTADWTHQYGDVANTLKSNDARVKLPLGILWFGGSSHMDVLPRHGHGPPEQVVAGRLYIQGMNSLSARDVYTGRVLWKRDFENLGTYGVYFDETYEDTPLDPKYNQVHIPGANGRGTNYVVTPDRVYILEGNVCHVLDAITGEPQFDIPMPAADNGPELPDWGYLGVYQDVLIGGQGFANYRTRHELAFDEDAKLSPSKKGFGAKSLDRAASTALVAFDRHTGRILWRLEANHSFWHNGIVAGNGKLFCLDRNPSLVEEAMQRRGLELPRTYRIAAVDIETGKLSWELREPIFGTWLGFSEKHDLLLQASAKASDRLATESGQGMAVLQGRDGRLVWKNEELKYAGPCILHNDWIITNVNSYTVSAGAYSLETGQPKLVPNPLTGVEQPWTLTRAYGCNHIVASENMLTYRSGAASFCDLTADAGTGSLGGFKSGCTSNLVVANGVLNAPDYTRTCSCAYQNQTSLALVHMPDVEVWSVDASATTVPTNTRIQHLAINFGAPGDRRDPRGKLWLEYPVTAGDAPGLSITLNAEAKIFQQHSSSMEGSSLPWVFASGYQGITELTLDLATHNLVKSPISGTGGDEDEEKSASHPKAPKPSRNRQADPQPNKKNSSGNPTEESSQGSTRWPPQDYRVRLYFATPSPLEGERLFDVELQGELAAAGVRLIPGDDRMKAINVLQIDRLSLTDELRLRLLPKIGLPVLNGMEIDCITP